MTRLPITERRCGVLKFPVHAASAALVLQPKDAAESRT
jgi:hypothetical protein